MSDGEGTCASDPSNLLCGNGGSQDKIEEITVTADPCVVNSLGYSGKLKGHQRALTIGEVNLAKSVFGNSVDYSDMKVNNRIYLPGMRSAAPDGNLYLAKKDRMSDFSEGSMAQKGFFIHEMTHVWQQQTTNKGVLGMFSWRNKNSSYSWKLVEGQPFDSYGMEQQGEIARELFYQKNGRRSHNQPGVQLDALTALVPWTGVECQ